MPAASPKPFALTGFALAAAVGGSAHAEAPEAGSVIENTASVSYFNTALGLTETLTTNTIGTVVNAVPDFEITSDQTYLRTPGEAAEFYFVVENTGNVENEVVVNFGDFDGTYDFSTVQAFVDTNQNGVVDPGEHQLTPDMNLSMPYGAQQHVIVLVDVPHNTSEGDRAAGTLSVSMSPGFLAGAGINSGPLSALTKTATAEVLVIDQTVDLRKQVAETDSGDLVYTLTFRNNSSTALQPGDLFGGPMIVDGVSEELLLVRDPIPLNTEFSSIIDPVDFDVVYHLIGESEEIWTRIQPTDLSDIDQIGFVTEDDLAGGSSRDLSFAVSVVGQGSELLINNTAQAVIPGSSGGVIVSSSNTVSTVFEGEAGTVGFYDTDEFGNEVDQVGFGADVFLQVDSGLCNVSPEIDEAVITVQTSPDGDHETVVAIETAPNSGIFRSVALPTAEGTPANPGDGILQGRRRSIATASVDCDIEAEAEMTLSPAGAVFLSATNEPVPGAFVELLDANGAVIDTATTDAEGLFEISPQAAGAHEIRVTPPTGLVAPSIRTSFSGYGRVVDPAASYGQSFSISTTNIGGNLNFDIPVDPDLTGALVAEKTGNKSSATIGELVEYQIDVRNTAPVAVQNGEIVDQLPPGVSFVPGSALLNGESLADPLNSAGQELVFPIELLSPNEEVELIYSAIIDPTVSEGDATNLAFATGILVGFDEPTQSNVASHTIDVDNSRGVFSRDGVVLGKVFLDCNLDGYQQNEDGSEPGVPGVLIHTQTGLSVVTDEHGQYSITGLDPKTHVLDVYEPSLPAGSTVSNTHVMDALNPGSRFVPIRAGEIRSEDFALETCAPNIVGDIQKRIEEAFARVEGVQVDTTELSLESQRGQRRDSHNQQAEGVVVSDIDLPQEALASAEADDVDVDLLELAQGQPQTLSFLNLSDGDQLVKRSSLVRLMGPEDLSLTLSKNGEVVRENRLGRRVADNGIQVLEFIALDLEPGENTFVLSGKDGFGNIRAEEVIKIIAPGKAAGIQLIAPETAVADSLQPVLVTLQVVDAKGRQTDSSTEITLLPGEDQFDVQDVSEQLPGTQVFLKDGKAVMEVLPSGKVGTRTIRATSPLGDAETDIQFVANAGIDPIAVGYIEGALNVAENFTIDALQDNNEISPFENTEEGVEANFYVKGEIFDDTLLTLRYESDKDLEQELFRSDEPDDFYPVYGDRSSRGYDAQSSGKGFALLERGTNYLLYGDVTYAPSSSAIQLGNYQRALEGGFVHFESESGRFRVDGYLGETDTGQTVLEIPARGISGPYDLGFGDVIRNSELVELVTRDREQPDVIIKTERLNRFSGYTLDYFARTLIFTRPIASRDENLNPVSIRVTFETDNGNGDDYNVYGAEATFDATDRVSFGARVLNSDGPAGTEDDRVVRSVYADALVGETGNLQLEVANTRNGEGESGSAARLSYEQQTEKGSYGARVAVSGENFDAPGASINSGREEARVFANRRVGDSGVLSGEAVYSASKLQSSERVGVVGRYETAISEKLRLRAGSRYVSQQNADNRSEDALTLIGGLAWTPEWMKGGAIDVELEQEVTDGSASRVAIGADYAITPKWRTYVQGEYSGSRTGEFGLADNFNEDVTFRAGTEYRLGEHVSAYSEFRTNRSFFDSGVAQGLTANWTVSPSLATRFRVEHVQPIGENFERNTAAGFGFTKEPEARDWIIDSDIDFSSGQSGRQTWYNSTTLGRQWQDVTLLARNRFAVSKAGGETRYRDRMRFGAAHRPKDDNALNTLAWYEYSLDDQNDVRENRHTWSVGGERKNASNLRMRGRWAGQYYSYTGGPAQIDIDEVTLLAQAGVDKDVHKRWNLGANVAAITDGRFEDQSLAAGVEANFILREDALLGLGYNYSKVKRESLESLYRTGLFVRARLKFDQDIWNIFDGEE